MGRLFSLLHIFIILQTFYAKKMFYEIHSNFVIEDGVGSVGEFISSSLLLCSQKCLKNKRCLTASYTKATKSCKLFENKMEYYTLKRVDLDIFVLSVSNSNIDLPNQIEKPLESYYTKTSSTVVATSPLITSPTLTKSNSRSFRMSTSKINQIKKSRISTSSRTFSRTSSRTYARTSSTVVATSPLTISTTAAKSGSTSFGMSTSTRNQIKKSRISTYSRTSSTVVATSTTAIKSTSVTVISMTTSIRNTCDVIRSTTSFNMQSNMLLVSKMETMQISSSPSPLIVSSSIDVRVISTTNELLVNTISTTSNGVILVHTKEPTPTLPTVITKTQGTTVSTTQLYGISCSKELLNLCYHATTFRATYDQAIIECTSHENSSFATGETKEKFALLLSIAVEKNEDYLVDLKMIDNIWYWGYHSSNQIPLDTRQVLWADNEPDLSKGRSCAFISKTGLKTEVCDKDKEKFICFKELNNIDDRTQLINGYSVVLRL